MEKKRAAGQLTDVGQAELATLAESMEALRQKNKTGSVKASLDLKAREVLNKLEIQYVVEEDQDFSACESAGFKRLLGAAAGETWAGLGRRTVPQGVSVMATAGKDNCSAFHSILLQFYHPVVQ